MSEDNLEIIDSYMSSAYKQGDVGEAITASELRNLGIRVIRNIYLPHRGRFTEVDMIGISPYGLFIIENKNYSGKVFGDINDKYWKVNYSIFKSSKLLNPVNQNKLHRDVILNILEENFNLDSKYIFRPVIFNDKCILSIRGAKKDVFTLSKFKDVYNNFVETGKEVISSDCQLKLYEFFIKYSNMSELMRDLHIFLMKGGE